jgi:hypothetical protein
VHTSPTMIVTIKDPGVTSDTLSPCAHSPRGIIRNQAQVSGAADAAPQGEPNHHPYPLSNLAELAVYSNPPESSDLGETGTFVAFSGCKSMQSILCTPPVHDV